MYINNENGFAEFFANKMYGIAVAVRVVENAVVMTSTVFVVDKRVQLLGNKIFS